MSTLNSSHNSENLRQVVSTVLECSVCLSMMCEPVSISCGHTFCRVCLVKSLRRHRKQCPSCREVCHVSAENAAENIALKSLAVSLDPVAYQQRLDESAAEKASWTALYPVFFYNQTMLPGNKLSLHLFEPRYKLMMSRIVNTNRAFAYISSHYRAEVSDVALIAELEEAEFLADGRCLLEATLKRRSRVVEHYVEDGTQGLHFCRLEPFADEEVPAAALEGLQQLRQRATALAEQLLSDAHTRRVVEQQFGSMPADVELFSMWFASISPLNDSEKTQALHSRSTVDRLALSVQRTETYLERRRNGRSFPIASAVSNTIATALTALLGGAQPDTAGSAASSGAAQGAGGDQDSVPDLIGSSSDSDMQDGDEDEEEDEMEDGDSELRGGDMSEDGESRPPPSQLQQQQLQQQQQQVLAWAARPGVTGGEEAGEVEQQDYESTSSSLPGFSH